jgi:peptidoglycan/xylan/chitin deacetylase (PgdA/CDA1 family)
MYHRIADNPLEKELSVSPGYFEEQLQVLRRTRHPLRLDKFIHNLITGTLPSDAVAVTFDDGYVDNLIAAKPRLAAADIPATVFLATGYLDRGEFWWDELWRLIVGQSNTRPFQLTIDGKTLHFDIKPQTNEGKVNVKNCTSAVRRLAIFRDIWGILRVLDDKHREVIMQNFRLHFSDTGIDSSTTGRAMTINEVGSLVEDGLVTIGGHTVTHPVLPGLGPDPCFREIIDSKVACEAITGAPVLGFAYPYGEFDAKARGAVIAAGFAFSCVTRHGPIIDSSDIFALPRIHIYNWNGDEFDRALRAWH